MASTVIIEWEGRPLEAANPDALADWAPELSEMTVRRSEQAVASVARLGDAVRSSPFVLTAQLLQRAEGVASSEIEALVAPGQAVAFAQAAGIDPGGDAAWIADNLSVVSAATGDRRRIDTGVLFDWHRQLMRHGRIDPSHIGAWRDRLGWVGGHSPRVAAHVAVPADRIAAHMDDLYLFCARDDIDPVTLAAVAHAQFETIHPFADGNGRIGRVLVSNLLARRCNVTVAPPLSLQIRRDVGGYQAGLSLYRSGHIDAWVRWFADTLITAATIAQIVLHDARAVLDTWEASVGDLRADSAARRLVTELGANPVVSAETAAGLCGVSEQAARNALGQLTERGVLTELDVTEPVIGRPRRWYGALGLLILLD